MSISDELVQTLNETAPASGDVKPSSQVLRLLERGFGTELAIVDGASGQLLYCPSDQPVFDLAMLAEFCRPVAHGGRPAFIGDEDPLLLLALPLPAADDNVGVAVGTFITRSEASDEELSRAATLLGLDSREVISWASRQTP